MPELRKKVICFSLWGDDRKYVVGAVRNAALARRIYPGWSVRFYVGTSVPNGICDELRTQGSELRRMDEAGNWRSLFWRFTAIADPDVDVMICRDTDSRLSSREKSAVAAWLASGKLVHLMRDHPQHRVPILGGMWGARKPVLQDIKQLIAQFRPGSYWQVDQQFLSEVILPRVSQSLCVHDEFFDRKAFPTPRQGLEFVGQVYDENDRPNEQHAAHLRAALASAQSRGADD